MKSILKFSIIALALLLSSNAEAKKIKLIFLYPGAQGTQEQAQPLLDNFSESLKKNSNGKIEAEIKYFASERAGEQYIQSQKPAGGILALDLFQDKSGAWQAQKILQTLQLPSADGTNQYFIVGNSKETLPKSGEVKLFSSRIFTHAFLSKTLFPDAQAKLSLENTKHVVRQLRKIGSGESPGFALLDQFEYATIKKLSSPWAKSLKVLATSPKVPSAPFVVFGDNISPEESKILKNALLKLSQDSQAADTMALLRIKGFKE